MRPFIRWPGGKRAVYDQILRRFPEKRFETYVEPFVGAGGGILGAIESGRFQRFVGNDACAELINALKRSAYSPGPTLEAIDELLKREGDEASKCYYQTRKRFNEELGTETIEQAARFVYLNFRCFNGLYRTNKNGSFNVPFGGRRRAFDSQNFKSAANALQRVWLATGDFESVEHFVDDKTLVYVDPPYIPINKETPRLYGSEFNKDAQLRTARFCRRLLGRGATVVASNSDAGNVGETNEFLLNAYEGFKVEKIAAPRNIGARAETRKTVTELLFIGVPE